MATILDKGLEEKILSEAGKRIGVYFDKTKINSSLLKDVGRFLGTGAPATTIKEAFLAASCLVAQPRRGLAEYVRFDDAQKLFSLIEERSKLAAKRKGNKGAKVLVLRWSILVLASPLTEVARKDITSTEHLVDAALTLCKNRMADIFTFHNKE